ncbi:hypothetical protein CDV36_015971 [Fusarium kuroshium]|uniref:Uncharacterized protein n=1 Tax=Fusarium kuroshium TaxID=2010991 RepID=A0A3M2R3E2_9HYPO|nr:hypothetical protein CDV36_015971 [Fusarium kuroshium]
MQTSDSSKNIWMEESRHGVLEADSLQDSDHDMLDVGILDAGVEHSRRSGPPGSTAGRVDVYSRDGVVDDWGSLPDGLDGRNVGAYSGGLDASQTAIRQLNAEVYSIKGHLSTLQNIFFLLEDGLPDSGRDTIMFDAQEHERVLRYWRDALDDVLDDVLCMMMKMRPTSRNRLR